MWADVRRFVAVETRPLAERHFQQGAAGRVPWRGKGLFPIESCGTSLHAPTLTPGDVRADMARRPSGRCVLAVTRYSVKSGDTLCIIGAAPSRLLEAAAKGPRVTRKTACLLDAYCRLDARFGEVFERLGLGGLRQTGADAASFGSPVQPLELPVGEVVRTPFDAPK